MARKSKGLPFVVQPRLQPIVERVGTEESGIIEIERRGYLSVAEKAIVQQATQGDDSIRKMYALGGRIARDTGKQQLQVMQDIMLSQRPDYMEPFEDEIMESIIEMMAFQERVDIVQATAMIICRVNEKWTVEQSMDLHPDLIKLLSELYSEEDRRSTEALEAAVQTDTGAEGK